MPFGVARVCYSAPVRTFADAGRDNRIIWYWVSDTRPFYEGETTFTPRVDDMFQPSGEEYELTGRVPNPRRYYSGRDIWGKVGAAVDGDEADFMGLALTDKYIRNGNAPQDPCGVPPKIVHLLRIGYTVSKFPPKIRLAQERLRLGQTVFEHGYPPPLYPEGLKIRHAIPVHGAHARDGEGLALRDDLGGGLHHKHRLRAGLLLGEMSQPGHTGPDVEALRIADALRPASLVRPIFGEGLKIGYRISVESLDPHVVETGLLIGERSFIPPALPWTFADGLKIGERTVMKVPVEPPLYKLGLRLGERSILDETVEPGASCPVAGLVLVHHTVGGYVSGSTHHWWRLNANSGAEFHVSLHILEGSNISAILKYGPDCDTLSSYPALLFDGDCVSFTENSDYIYLVEVFALPLGEATYQIDFETGSCP